MVSRLLFELNAIIGQDRVDKVGHHIEHAWQELRGGVSVSRIRPYFSHIMKTLYVGLAKSRAQLFTLFALGNRFSEQRRLMV